jgi:hypothetical protein
MAAKESKCQKKCSCANSPVAPEGQPEAFDRVRVAREALKAVD